MKSMFLYFHERCEKFAEIESFIDNEAIGQVNLCLVQNKIVFLFPFFDLWLLQQYIDNALITQVWKTDFASCFLSFPVLTHQD